MKSPVSSGLIEAIRANPRRSLVAVFFFLIVAGVVGGPVAGALESDGGFTSSDADSALAVERLQEVTGTDPNVGIVLQVEGGGAQAVADELDAIDGMAETTVGGSSTDGASTMVLGTLEADANDADVAAEVVDGFEDDDGVTIGGPAVIGLQLGEHAGASGFLLKDIEPQTLIDAVRLVHEGQALLAPQVTKRLIEAYVDSGTLEPTAEQRPAPAPPDGLGDLTPREREVLTLVGRGMSNHEIAEHLVLSPLTAKTHVSRVMGKLRSRDRAQLVVAAYEAGLMD